MFLQHYKNISSLYLRCTNYYAFVFADAVKPPVSSLQTSAELPLPVNTSPPSMQAESSLPPPYQLINIPPLESSSGQEDPQDYLLLINCQSKKPEPMR